MSSINVVELLSSDKRFLNRSKALQTTSLKLGEFFASGLVNNDSSFNIIRNVAHFLNVLQNADIRKDSFVSYNFTSENLKQLFESNDYSMFDYEDVLDSSLRSTLGSDFIDYKDLDFSDISNSSENPMLHLINEVSRNTEISSIAQHLSKSSPSILFNEDDADFWAHSVDLDFPMFPQVNSDELVYSYKDEHYQYCIYGESVLPWTQSQISCVSDVNKFSDEDILRLFPPIRLYTRRLEMYQQYDKVEFDEDLGCILKISGYTKKQIRKNIIEFPHLDGVDRIVKRKGREITIPFWRHIELDGQIYKTVDIWDELKDTQNLPRVESFMREYVIRRYLLEEAKGIEHKYPMRGTFLPFLTLYNTPEYYESLGYDPVDIGRKCVIARQSFKYTRNPIIRMIENAKLSVQ